MLPTVLVRCLFFIQSVYCCVAFFSRRVDGFRVYKAGIPKLVTRSHADYNWDVSHDNELFGVAESRGDVSGNRNNLRKPGILTHMSPGISTVLPIGKRIVNRIERVIHVEMSRIGAKEVELPMLLSSDTINERRNEFGRELFSLTDRNGKHYDLCPTCEELICRMLDKALSPLSKRNLPIYLYQIGRKFRDEARPCNSNMRCREFTMKDAYSFHSDKDSAAMDYNKFKQAYERIFTLLELSFDTVTIGDTEHEFRAMLPNKKTLMEIAHIFQLGNAITTEAGLKYEAEGRTKHPVYLNSYGIGIHRLLQAAASQHADSEGIRLPQIIAPYDVAVIPCDENSEEASADIYTLLSQRGIDTFLDTRKAPINQRVSDMMNIGIPHIVYVSSVYTEKAMSCPNEDITMKIIEGSKKSNYYHQYQSPTYSLLQDKEIPDTIQRINVGYSHRSFPGEYTIPVPNCATAA
uniref:proline--tRNA ligase n=1 Tax=Babesia bovis TaxID=5865 RepID=S6CAQ5_BABBO|nr:tRNA synthetase class II core domain containing protein [Babesia bovis]